MLLSVSGIYAIPKLGGPMHDPEAEKCILTAISFVDSDPKKRPNSDELAASILDALAVEGMYVVRLTHG